MFLPLTDPPPPFVMIRRGAATLWIRPEAKDRAVELLESGVSLHRAARSRALARPGGLLHGRGPVPLIPGARDGERWAVRHYHRGGLLAPVTGDRYLRSWALPRPLAEAAASERCRERGIATPRVMAAAIYGRGPIYRGDLVTRYLPGSVTLGRFLLPEEGGRSRRPEALELAGRLTRILSLRGVLHRDLNVKNILLVPTASPLEGYILDLDRVQISREGEVRGEPMFRRLLRSLQKWERRSGQTLEEDAWEALRLGWAEGASRD